MHAENEQPGEEQVAHDRVSEKHPGGSGAVLRETNGERLDKSREILHVTRIAQPRESVRDGVKENRAGERSRKQRLPRSAISENEPEEANNRQRQITACHERREHRCAVMKIEDEIGNEESNQRHREFEPRWQIRCAAESYGGQRGEVREPGRA